MTNNEATTGCPIHYHTQQGCEYCISIAAMHGALDTKAMCQWWTMQSEQFRKSVVADVSGSMSYGLTVSWSLMPERAKALVIAAYEEHLVFVATLETPVDPVADAIAQFRPEFGLRAYPGKRFRISVSASYISDFPNPGTVYLYTQIQDGETWRDFAKGTIAELKAQIEY